METDISFDDGKFEVLLIKKPRKLRELWRIIKCIIYRHYDDQYIYLFKASNVYFAFEKDIKWSIDGEYAGTLGNVQIKNLPCTLKVMTT